MAENKLDLNSKFDARYLSKVLKWINVIAAANGDHDGDTCDSTPFHPYTCSSGTNPCFYDSSYIDLCTYNKDVIDCLAAVPYSFACHPSQNKVDTRLARQAGRKLRKAKSQFNRRKGCAMPPY